MLPLASALATELDDNIDFGGFKPSMTLEEADALAGSKGTRECKTWPPNPTVHWCKWTFQDDAQHVEIGYGPDGVIYDIERRVPLPDGMPDEEALAQAAEKFSRYGPPAKDIIPENLHWGCKGDDCSGPRMIRVWIMQGHATFFEGRRHIAIGWVSRVRRDRNQQRFESQSRAWHAKPQKELSRDRSRLNL